MVSHRATSLVGSLFGAVVVQGVSHVTTQLVLLQALLGIGANSEFVVGAVLASWWLLMGLGTRFFPNSRSSEVARTRLLGLLLVMAALPLLTLLGLRAMRNLVLVAGATPSLGQTGVLVLGLLGPYALVSGGALRLSMEVEGARGGGEGAMTRVFVADAMGDAIGGLLVLGLLPLGVNHVQLLLIVGGLLAMSTMVLAQRFAGMRVRVGAALVFGGLLVAGGAPLEKLSMGWLFPGRQLLQHRNSPAADLVVASMQGQLDLFADGQLLASTAAIEAAEERVYFPMAQGRTVQNVLVVGAAHSGLLEELLRYPIARLDCLEPDRDTRELVQRFITTTTDSRLHFIPEDSRRFARQALRRYELIVVDLPTPTTLGQNRFYTEEYLRDLRRSLSAGGVVALTLGEYDNVLMLPMARLLEAGLGTLGSVFRHVTLVPLERPLLMASEEPLTREPELLRARRQVPPRWMTDSVLNGLVAPDRLAPFVHLSAHRGPINRDDGLVLVSLALERDMARLTPGLAVLFAVVGAVSIMGFLLLGRGPMVAGVAGFVGISVEMLLLLCLGRDCGAIHAAVVAVITGYLVGSVGAAALVRRLRSPRRSTLVWSLLGLGGLALGVVPLVSAAGLFSLPPVVVVGAYTLFAGLVGCATGTTFLLIGRLRGVDSVRTVAQFYAADLGGAALGAAGTGTVLLPALGITQSSLAVAGLCGLALLPLVFGRFTLKGATG